MKKRVAAAPQNEELCRNIKKLLQLKESQEFGFVWL